MAKRADIGSHVALLRTLIAAGDWPNFRASGLSLLEYVEGRDYRRVPRIEDPKGPAPGHVWTLIERLNALIAK